MASSARRSDPSASVSRSSADLTADSAGAAALGTPVGSGVFEPIAGHSSSGMEPVPVAPSGGMCTGGRSAGIDTGIEVVVEVGALDVGEVLDGPAVVEGLDAGTEVVVEVGSCAATSGTWTSVTASAVDTAATSVDRHPARAEGVPHNFTTGQAYGEGPATAQGPERPTVGWPA